MLLALVHKPGIVVFIVSHNLGFCIHKQNGIKILVHYNVTGIQTEGLSWRHFFVSPSDIVVMFPAHSLYLDLRCFFPLCKRWVKVNYLVEETQVTSYYCHLVSVSGIFLFHRRTQSVRLVFQSIICFNRWPYSLSNQHSPVEINLKF